MNRFIIHTYHHGFKVQVLYHQDKKIMTDYCSSLDVFELRYDYKTKRSKRVFKMTYATFIPRTVTYGLHKNLYTSFIEHLKYNRVSDNEIQINIHDANQGAKGYLKLAKDVKLRPHQIPIVDFIMSPGYTKVLPIQTGFGKTLMSLYSIAKLKTRAAIVMGAKHIGTWLKDSAWMFDNGEDQIITIQGKKELCNLIEVAKTGELNKSVIIISINTLRDYLTEFEKHGISTYGCLPIDFYDVLQVGIRVTDEAHENLHFGFRQDIETSVDKAIYLSATIDSHDPFINKMYNVIFPQEFRYVGLKWDKFIAVHALGYMIKDSHRVQCTGNMGYSHTEFEKWIMRDKTRLNNYLNMIKSIVMENYVKKYLPGQKLLIYMSTIALCDMMAKYLKGTMGEKFKCHAYTGIHLDTVLHSNDIVVSTPIKSGSGKDIKGLAVTISTVAVNAKEKNIQMAGRLRKLDELYPGLDPLFIYLVALNIPKHLEYHHAKMELFKPLVKSIDTYRTGFII